MAERLKELSIAAKSLIPAAIAYNLQILPDSLMSGSVILAILLVSQPLLALAGGALFTQMLTSVAGKLLMKFMPNNAELSATKCAEICVPAFSGKAWSRLLSGSPELLARISAHEASPWSGFSIDEARPEFHRALAELVLVRLQDEIAGLAEAGLVGPGDSERYQRLQRRMLASDGVEDREIGSEGAALLAGELERGGGGFVAGSGAGIGAGGQPQLGELGVAHSGGDVQGGRAQSIGADVDPFFDQQRGGSRHARRRAER
jgi:hypothetical protein